MMAALPAAGAVAGTITISGGVTNENIDWFSLQTTYNRVGITVVDADANVATDLAGTCTSGVLTFKCELVGIGGEGTGTGTDLGKKYSVTNTPMVDRNSDDIPDSVTVRSLQAGQSFLLSTASAAGGTLTLSAATAGATKSTGATAAKYVKQAPTAVGADTVATGLTTQLVSPSKIEVDFTSVVAADALGVNGVTIIGTSVNPTTMAETTGATEVIGASADLDALDNADTAGDDSAATIRGTTWWKSITSFAVDHAFGTFNVAINELETVAVGYQYDVQDTITGLVSVTSTSAPAAVAVDVTEANTVSGKASGSFANTVVLTSDISKNGAFCTAAQVTDTADDCGATTEKQLYVANGDLITTSYKDASPAATVTDTARVDLTAPVITLISPADKSHSSVGTPTFSVQVIDDTVAASASAGITDTDINFKLMNEGGAAGDVAETRSPVTRGFQVSLLESTARPEGKLSWWADVKDKVGNVPASTVVGASTTKPYVVTFDYSAPTLATAETGLGLKNVGLTTEAQTTNDKTKIKVGFTLGTGTVTFAPIEASTVAPNDFRVDGVAPSAVSVNTAGDAVYLTVAAMATDYRPKVELTGEIADKANNKRTSGSVTNATDKLSPVITVATTPSSSTTLSKEKVTITIQSSETLVATPTATIATDAAFTFNVTAPSVTSSGVNSWTASFTAPTAAATKWWLKVAGTDINANGEIVGDGTTTSDVHFFQVDTLAPLVTVTPTTVAEGDIFVRLIFDEDEGKVGATAGKARGDATDTAPTYTDEFKKVTLTKATLTNQTTAVTTDVLADFFTKDSIEYVLVKNLGVAKYDVAIEFKDEAGNTGTKTATIDVTARAKATISLTPGFNYFSLQGAPLSGNINDVISTTDPINLVVAYDSSLANPWLTSTRDPVTNMFVGDISTLTAGQGYIARATAFVDVKVDIPTAAYNTLPGVTMVKGNAWSLIGAATRGGGATVVADNYLVGTKWSVCVTFDPDPSTGGWSSVRPGTSANLNVNAAYFCWFQEDGTIVQQ